MIHALQRLAISFPLYVMVLTVTCALMPAEQPRSIVGIAVPLFVLALFVSFGIAFVSGLSRSRWLPSRPLPRFLIPIFGGGALLIVASFLGIRLGAFIRHLYEAT